MPYQFLFSSLPYIWTLANHNWFRFCITSVYTTIRKPQSLDSLYRTIAIVKHWLLRTKKLGGNMIEQWTGKNRKIISSKSFFLSLARIHYLIIRKTFKNLLSWIPYPLSDGLSLGRVCNFSIFLSLLFPCLFANLFAREWRQTSAVEETARGWFMVPEIRHDKLHAVISCRSR